MLQHSTRQSGTMMQQMSTSSEEFITPMMYSVVDQSLINTKNMSYGTFFIKWYAKHPQPEPQVYDIFYELFHGYKF